MGTLNASRLWKELLVQSLCLHSSLNGQVHYLPRLPFHSWSLAKSSAKSRLSFVPWGVCVCVSVCVEGWRSEMRSWVENLEFLQDGHCFEYLENLPEALGVRLVQIVSLFFALSHTQFVCFSLFLSLSQNLTAEINISNAPESLKVKQLVQWAIQAGQ